MCRGTLLVGDGWLVRERCEYCNASAFSLSLVLNKSKHNGYNHHALFTKPYHSFLFIFFFLLCIVSYSIAITATTNPLVVSYLLLSSHTSHLLLSLSHRHQSKLCPQRNTKQIAILHIYLSQNCLPLFFSLSSPASPFLLE